MLTIYGRPDSGSKTCDGVSRRNFLKIGGFAMGGLSLPQLLSMEAQAGLGRSHKAVIMIYLPGGPSHLDMWDLKPNAPVEVRGEFDPIKTNVPGIEIGEMFPRMAGMMDKLVPIRSITGSEGGHDAYQCMTGRRKGDQQKPPGGWPAFGAWSSHEQGTVNPAVPANVSLMYKTGHREWGDPGDGGFLGMGHSPFNLVGGRGESMKADNMTLQGITLERLQDRKNLLTAIDGLQRNLDSTGKMGGMDAFTEQAVGILTSSKLADALDLSKEDPAVVARYGDDDATFMRDGSPRMVRNFCVARRLVEAGARVVTLNFSRWDWHGGDGMNYPRSREDMPRLDQGLTALVSDLHERGLDRDVTVLVWGEFGRTPKINARASRDHWPKVAGAMMAGGGMRTGQVLGATDRIGGEAADRPVTHQEVFATLYRNLGFNLSAVRQFDLRGRPQYPIEPGTRPLHELI